MNNKKRSAFTIVELVIVIAVIAILSAVLIPTFGAIIKDANVAADQTAASALTTELHIYLKGNTIDSEEELMAALASKENGGSGIGEKLVPKAFAYGYHFWFDIENQAIVLATGDEIANKPDKEHRSANISFRDVYGKGYYLIDGDGTLVDVVETLSSKDTGVNEFKNALGKLNGFENEDALCDKIVDTVNSTIIVTNNGTFYPENATNVSFAAGVTSITSTQYSVTTNSTTTSVNTTPAPTNELPLTSGNVVIPDSVTCVEDNSFNFVEGSTVKLEVKDENLNIFCPNSTNVTISTETYPALEIVKSEENATDAEGNPVLDESGNPVKVQQIVVKDTTTVVVEELVSTEGRFPGYDFGIIPTNDENGTYAWNNGTLYVAHNNFNNLGNKFELELTNDGTSIIEDTKGLVKWTFDAGVSVGSILDENNTKIYNVLGATTGGHVKGEVTLRDGSADSVEFDVVVVKPTGAVVTIGDKVINMGENAQQTPTFEWGYDGTNGTKDVSFLINNYTHQIAHGTSNLEVDVDSDAFTYDKTTQKLTLNTKGGTGDDAINLVKTGDVDITLTIDGVLVTTVKITVRDYTKAEFVSNYRYTASDKRPYYIGNGQINLGHILKLKASELTYDTYKVSVEVKFGNTYMKVDVQEGWDVEYDHTLAKGSWGDVKINIKSGTNNTPIRVKITPANAENDAYTVAINLTYVNGTNVIDAATLLTAANAENTNVVIMKEITLADTANSSNYVLNFATGETLYGNGFVVNATKYVSGTAQTYYRWEKTGQTERCTVCGSTSPSRDSGCKKYSYGGGHGTNSWGSWTNIETTDVYNHVNKGEHYISADACLINLTGGTLDNIYINGPVYPNLQYVLSDGTLSSAYTEASDAGKANATNVSTVTLPYFVSGIKVTGDSSVINSYVSGFRQPIKVDGATLDLKNSTLYGGNYANLQFIKGTLNLTDVTTVQPNSGVADTFGQGKEVIGLGIAVEPDAVNGTTSAINVSGYLDQYNWIAENTLADLPEITVDGAKINLKTVLAAMFNGIKVTAFGETAVDRKLEFLGNYTETIDGVDYLNTGIMFISMGTGDSAQNSYLNIGGVLNEGDTATNNLIISDQRTANSGSAKLPAYTATILPLFSKYPVLSIRSWDINASQMVRAFEKFVVDNSAEGQGKATADFTSVLTSGTLTKDPVDVCMKVWSYHNTQVDLGSTSPINYPGYTYN